MVPGLRHQTLVASSDLTNRHAPRELAIMQLKFRCMPTARHFCLCTETGPSPACLSSQYSSTL